MTKAEQIEAAAVALAAGASLDDVAMQIDVSVRQLFNLSQDPRFTQRVAEIRTEATEAAVNKLSMLARKAAQTLEDALDNGSTAEKLKAVGIVLERLMPMVEHFELRRRIDALEMQQAAKDAA